MMLITIGDFGSAKASGGHSTNFAKLKRNAALRRYSEGGVSCARLLPTAISRAETTVKIKVAQKRMRRKKVRETVPASDRLDSAFGFVRKRKPGFWPARLGSTRGLVIAGPKSNALHIPIPVPRLNAVHMFGAAKE